MSASKNTTKPSARETLQNAISAGHWSAGPIYAATSLGLRKGEICGLKRTDLSDGVLTLQRQRNWIDGEKSRLKQRGEGEVRRIGLPQEIIDRLLSIEMSNGISSSSRIQTIWRWNRFMPNFT